MGEAESSPEPKPAPRLGSYLLVHQLGSGGMSNVFRAVHEESGSVVAVKVLPRSLAKNLTLLQRFIREAKSAEALDHPNIVAIFDRGFDQGRHYLVLEYVEGRDLHDRVRLNGPLGVDEAIGFVREVAEGLRYAAGRGMVHRDVKPANLLMTPDGHAKIIDLGLALQTDDEDERVTRDGTTVGTVDYMAPEQARDSRQTSERSDIYSLGCTFYYLLTGSQPYPGGGVADKLSRHFKAPIPDVRQLRPEVPEALSLLIRRMMEKKPERRFADYTELIAALDALSDPSAIAERPVTMDALIVDDEDDEIGLAPTDSAIRGPGSGSAVRPPSTRVPLMAEVLDDDQDDLPAPASESRPPSKPRVVPGRREPSPPAEVSLAELAALDDHPTPKAARRPAPSAPVVPAFAEPSLDAILEEEEDEEPVEGEASGVRRGGAELSLQTWIAAGVMVGLSVVVVGFGVFMLISYAKPQPAEVAARPDSEPGTEPTEALPGPIARPNRPSPKAPNRPTPPPAPSFVINPAPTVADSVPAPVVPKEVPAEEVAYSKDWETRLGPPPSPADSAPADRPRVVVRRVVEGGDEPQSASIAVAFARSGDLVEIADTGPFFEDDVQVAGKSRLIRARPGLRPMIKIESTSQSVVKEQEAKFVLGGARLEQLILEGIDLAVDLRDLPEKQSALFLCRGAEVILRDCSITLANAANRRMSRFSLFRLEEGARPNRVVLERTTIRGPIRTLIDVTSARAEVVLERSLVVGEAGPLIAIEAADRASRSIHLYRSLIATRGPFLEWSGRSSPPAVRSLGSTFARVDGGTVPGLFHSRSAFSGEPRSVLDWSGEDNAFVGWPAWMTAGPDASHRLAGLDAARAAWPGTDGTSKEGSGPWPASLARDDVPVAREDVAPADFLGLAPGRAGTLAKIATPHPRLREMTFGSIARQPAPELSTTLIPPFVPPTVATTGPGPAMPAVPVAAPPPPARPIPNATKPQPRVKPAPAPGAARPDAPPRPSGPLEVTFDVQAAPWAGDLGLFLAEKLVEGTTRATVRIRGGGVHPMSPIRLPDGLSIALMTEGPEGPGAILPTFVARPEAAGRAMLELKGGDLAMANIAFASDGMVRPRHWVRVEDGLLALRHCRIRDPGGAAPNVGPAISFVSTSSEPITPRVGPFASATDRATARLKDCLIWTGGDAISADLARGVVVLENCLVISGGPSVSLWPRKAAHDRFEADLVLERCSIASGLAPVFLGPWPGDAPGPDRPWLVSTRSCVFPRTQVGSAGGLLMVDPGAMARGALFWQSIFDAYEVGRFVASTGPTPPNPPSADLKKNWVNLWGESHARSDRGPDPPRTLHVLRFKDKERPRPGKVVPGALELDPKNHKDLGVEFRDLPPAPRA